MLTFILHSSGVPIDVQMRVQGQLQTADSIFTNGDSIFTNGVLQQVLLHPPASTSGVVLFTGRTMTALKVLAFGTFKVRNCEAASSKTSVFACLDRLTGKR